MANKKKVVVKVMTWGEYKQEMKDVPDDYKMLTSQHMDEDTFQRAIRNAHKTAAALNKSS